MWRRSQQFYELTADGEKVRPIPSRACFARQLENGESKPVGRLL